MIVILLAALMHNTNEHYALSAKWKTFCEKHLIDWDRSDPATKKWLDEQEKKDGEE